MEDKNKVKIIHTIIHNKTFWNTYDLIVDRLLFQIIYDFQNLPCSFYPQLCCFLLPLRRPVQPHLGLLARLRPSVPFAVASRSPSRQFSTSQWTWRSSRRRCWHRSSSGSHRKTRRRFGRRSAEKFTIYDIRKERNTDGSRWPDPDNETPKNLDPEN